MSSSGFRGVVQGISLRTLTAWPTVIAAVTLVLLTFTAGDSPDPNANTGAYWLGAVGQVALAGALLVAAAISARMLNLNVTGPAAIGVLFAASFAAALIVRPPGSLYTTYRANGELLPTVVVALFITVVWTIVAVAVHAVRQYRQHHSAVSVVDVGPVWETREHGLGRPPGARPRGCWRWRRSDDRDETTSSARSAPGPGTSSAMCSTTA